MSDKARLSRTADCDVCGVAHDEEIHEATLSVHRWLRSQIKQYLYEEEEQPEVQVA